jgi:elongation factor G
MLCGSALKNKGIQPLLDSIVHFLPSPVHKKMKGVNKVTKERFEHSVDDPNLKKRLSALAFKVVNDKDKGPVTFFRVYSGIMKQKTKLLNTNLNIPEKHS